MASWYAIYTHVGHERRVASELKARKVEHYLPMQTVWRHLRTTKNARIERPLMPRYLFARVGMSELFAMARDAPGAEKIIRRADGLPAEIPAEFIERVKAMQDEGAFDRTRKAKPAYAKGQRVKVTGGPFQGYFAEFMESITDREVRVLLKEFMGSDVLTKIDVDKIARAA